METMILAAGIPSAITGLIVWWIKKKIDKQDEERQQREKNQERLMILIMQTGRATSVLSEATARAVQPIPDAHCNGDHRFCTREIGAGGHQLRGICKAFNVTDRNTVNAKLRSLVLDHLRRQLHYRFPLFPSFEKHPPSTFAASVLRCASAPAPPTLHSSL